jgi:hypothetical protein
MNVDPTNWKLFWGFSRYPTIFAEANSAKLTVAQKGEEGFSGFRGGCGLLLRNKSCSVAQRSLLCCATNRLPLRKGAEAGDFYL